jgi:hypothetical protein
LIVASVGLLPLLLATVSVLPVAEGRGACSGILIWRTLSMLPPPSAPLLINYFDYKLSVLYKLNPNIMFVRMRKINDDRKVYRWGHSHPSGNRLYVGDIEKLQVGTCLIEALDKSS